MEPEKIVFPCDYPIKVVARADASLRERLDAVFEKHFGPFGADRVSGRESAQKNFSSYTYLMHVREVGQLSAVHADLQATDGVVLVI
jgi:uncharacterized protein